MLVCWSGEPFTWFAGVSVVLLRRTGRESDCIPGIPIQEGTLENLLIQPLLFYI